MSENLTFNQDVATENQRLYKEFKGAKDNQAEMNRRVRLQHDIGKLASAGSEGRRSERKARAAEIAQLKTELPAGTLHHSAPYDEKTLLWSPDFRQDANSASSNVFNNLKASKAFAAENNGALYENAVIEANIDFANRGSDARIKTPNALQEMADTAASLSAEHVAAQTQAQTEAEQAQQAQLADAQNAGHDYTYHVS